MSPQAWVAWDQSTNEGGCQLTSCVRKWRRLPRKFGVQQRGSRQRRNEVSGFAPWGKGESREENRRCGSMAGSRSVRAWEARSFQRLGAGGRLPVEVGVLPQARGGEKSKGERDNAPVRDRVRGSVRRLYSAGITEGPALSSVFLSVRVPSVRSEALRRCVGCRSGGACWFHGTFMRGGDSQRRRL